MKRILGLDLGTNSIGWASVIADEIANENENERKDLMPANIEAAGSRVIPMDAAILGDFDKGNSISQTSERTGYRGVRRLRERYLLRRERLNRVLNRLNFLPKHYAQSINKYGKFIDESEPKIAWKENESGQMEFIFQKSFHEMLSDFRKIHPELLSDNLKIPYDWTLYYLRKKALYQAVTKEELAWILLNFNQKRGYYQLRGEEEEEDKCKKIEFYALKVVAVEDSGEKKGKDTWYNVHLENGWIYRRTSNTPLDWIGKTKEFIVTTDYNNDGTPKTDREGNVKRSFRAPQDNDWTLIKKKTEFDIDKSGKSVGAYIYDSLLQNPKQKIVGKLVRTIERKYYKAELKTILDTQKRFIPELQDVGLYTDCVEELYPQNESHRNNIANNDFTYLFLNDILFYQRPLKSKKSLVDDCPYETRFDNDGNKHTIKCIAKSHPLYQEFRLWQFIGNLKIYQHEKIIDGKLTADIDVTNEFLKNNDDYVALFEWLNDRKDVSQDILFGLFFKIKKSNKEPAFPYRWNYVEDKAYPCNETRAMMLNRLEKAGISKDFLDNNNEESLWHILYSVEDKIEIEKALKSYAKRHNLSDAFVDAFRKCPPFTKDYGAYSAKAIKKLLPLMRKGKYWNEYAIDYNTRIRIDKILDGEFDEKIRNRVREKTINLTKISDFQGLPLWLACYIVYDRHSEVKDIVKWESPDDIDNYLKGFKQHSLRNPIVEQVITETLRTVRDIWKHFGKIDEIHVELGREMKNPADKRAKMTQQITENENANLRIKALLCEFLNPEYAIDNVRPYSPSQQDILRIYEDYALKSFEKYDKDTNSFVYDADVPDFVTETLKKFNESDVKKRPTSSEIMRYKLWLEQRYRSPYTGDMIPLGKLFTSAYEIEHIIPQSLFFDDSFSNKVICESEVNKLKDNSLAYEFIKNHHGEKVQLNLGKTVEILSVDAYEKFVKDNYSRSQAKMKKLMMDEIPDKFIERQLNDSRYISKVVKALLSNVVREKDENGEYEQEATSKNVISCSGGITDRLKKDWGINDVWNRIVLPRFQRLNNLTHSKQFTSFNSEGKEIPDMPLELQKGFNKKRIDHRHHAMDAIVIACATRDHVNLLNNEAAKPENKANYYQLSHKLRRYEKIILNGKERNVPKEFLKPWPTFIQDTQNVLRNVIVSFKQNLRVINKTTNHYLHYENGKKILTKQVAGDSWAIRKPLHKETVFAKVNLRKIREVRLNIALENPKTIVEKDLKEKIKELINIGYDAKQITKYFNDNKEVWNDVNLNKIKIYYFTNDTKEKFFASRIPLDTSFDRNKIENCITDTGIQKILMRHLEANNNDPELAFSADGIDELNRNIVELNNGKYHQPIYKVRKYEKAEKYAVGVKGNKSSKYVEAAKGTNLFFAIYESISVDEKTGDEQRVRSYVTIPLNMVIECQKNAGKKWKENLDAVLKEKEMVAHNCHLLFILSPNDLVYLPTNEQIKNGIDEVDRDRIYKMVSCTGNEGHFVPLSIASPILQTIELGSNNKAQRAWTNEMIKETCIPLSVDRLGNIIELNGQKL